MILKHILYTFISYDFFIFDERCVLVWIRPDMNYTYPKDAVSIQLMDEALLCFCRIDFNNNVLLNMLNRWLLYT